MFVYLFYVLLRNKTYFYVKKKKFEKMKIFFFFTNFKNFIERVHEIT